MTALHRDIALGLGQQRCTVPRILFHRTSGAEETERWRSALRQAGVPVLELNEAVGEIADRWLVAASELSAEFLMPVVVMGAVAHPELIPLDQSALIPTDTVEDTDWCLTRQVALTRAVETAGLNQEFRRSRERKGWIRLGWQPDFASKRG